MAGSVFISGTSWQAFVAILSISTELPLVSRLRHYNPACCRTIAGTSQNGPRQDHTASSADGRIFGHPAGCHLRSRGDSAGAPLGTRGAPKCPAHSEPIHRGRSAGSSFFPQDLPPGGSNLGEIDHDHRRRHPFLAESRHYCGPFRWARMGAPASVTPGRGQHGGTADQSPPRGLGPRPDAATLDQPATAPGRRGRDDLIAETSANTSGASVKT